MNLRELTLADAPWCAELEQLLFPGDSPWSVEEFQSEIAHVLTKYFGVEISGRLVGYAGMRWIPRTKAVASASSLWMLLPALLMLRTPRYSLKFALTMSRRWRCTTATDLRR